MKQKQRNISISQDRPDLMPSEVYKKKKNLKAKEYAAIYASSITNSRVSMPKSL